MTKHVKSLDPSSKLHSQEELMEGGRVNCSEHKEETDDSRMTEERGSTPKKDRAAYS